MLPFSVFFRAFALLCPVEVREELEETSNPSDLLRLAQTNHAALKQLYHEIDQAYRNGDITQMKYLTIKLSYMQNIETEIYKKMPVN